MSGAFVAAAIAKARRRIAHHFLDANATAEDRAVAFEPGSRPMQKRMFDQMTRFGVLREGAKGTWWLDEKRYADFRKERIARVLGILAIAGFAAAGAMAIGG